MWKKDAKSPVFCCFRFTTGLHSLIIKLTKKELKHFRTVLFCASSPMFTSGGSLFPIQFT